MKVTVNRGRKLGVATFITIQSSIWMQSRRNIFLGGSRRLSVRHSRPRGNNKVFPFLIYNFSLKIPFYMG